MEIEEIYKVYINDVYRYLFSLSRSHHVAEDLMQETFYRAYLYLEDYENQKVKSWLFKVAYHTFIDFVRKEKKVTFVGTEELETIQAGESTEEYVVAKNSYEKLIQIIHAFPVMEAQAILLCDVHQLTYEEGASVLDLKLNTYKSHVFRGRKRLKELLQEALHQRPASLPDGKQEQVSKIGKKRARITNVLIVFTFLLLIQPILYISTLLYYTLAPTNAMEIRNVVNQTLSVTEPNVFLKDRDMEQTLLPLSLQLHFDLYKRVGKKDIRIGEEKTDYVFSRATKVSREYTTDEKIPEILYADNEVLSHPNNYNTSYNSSDEAQVLKGLPQESVVEAFVSFRELLSVQEVTDMFSTIDIVWYAVNTGLEEKQMNNEGMYVAPIGFPADIISMPSGAFASDSSHEEQFIDVLKSLQKHENLAVKLSRAKVLELSKRISFLEKNGVKTYGAVVTGPKVEIEKLMSHEKVRNLKVGEVRLWNWHS